ncbi:hypothetical protein [Fodinicurvata sp. EGI_FJ10296]|jgi:peptidoglycan/xylan/chitin deacetylase (PgdA/CDA1 family)|uniref:polysaccharide deacetylase family protein n=1 Tax=Fodinicurvata sp. EGI_FJ10296 TaxID=3231908 RepID=UPI00345124EA
MTSNPRIPYRLSYERPALAAPDGKRLIVHCVVNVEAWQFDQPMPRTIITAPHGREAVPDIPNFSWAEYGMRCGMPRLLDLFGDLDLPVSCSFNAGVIDVYPECADAILRAGWEFVGHGLHQSSIQGTSDEAALIGAALDKISSFTGQKVRGWLGPGLRESKSTPDHLARAGVDYICDWVLDDLPCWMSTAHRPVIAMPYTLELNDSIMFAIERKPSEEFLRRFSDTLDRFDREAAGGARIITLGLHPHLIAVPHRIDYLERIVETLRTRDDTIFMTGSAIADWYASAEPPPN